eukprot:187639-Amphidinium_carterae.2
MEADGNAQKSNAFTDFEDALERVQVLVETADEDFLEKMEPQAFDSCKLACSTSHSCVLPVPLVRKCFSFYSWEALVDYWMLMLCTLPNFGPGKVCRSLMSQHTRCTEKQATLDEQL